MPLLSSVEGFLQLTHELEPTEFLATELALSQRNPELERWSSLGLGTELSAPGQELNPAEAALWQRPAETTYCLLVGKQLVQTSTAREIEARSSLTKLAILDDPTLVLRGEYEFTPAPFWDLTDPVQVSIHDRVVAELKEHGRAVFTYPDGSSRVFMCDPDDPNLVASWTLTLSLPDQSSTRGDTESRIADDPAQLDAKNRESTRELLGKMHTGHGVVLPTESGWEQFSIESLTETDKQAIEQLVASYRGGERSVKELWEELAAYQLPCLRELMIRDGAGREALERHEAMTRELVARLRFHCREENNEHISETEAQLIDGSSIFFVQTSRAQRKIEVEAIDSNDSHVSETQLTPELSPDMFMPTQSDSDPNTEETNVGQIEISSSENNSDDSQLAAVTKLPIIQSIFKTEQTDVTHWDRRLTEAPMKPIEVLKPALTQLNTLTVKHRVTLSRPTQYPLGVSTPGTFVSDPISIPRKRQLGSFDAVHSDQYLLRHPATDATLPSAESVFSLPRLLAELSVPVRVKPRLQEPSTTAFGVSSDPVVQTVQELELNTAPRVMSPEESLLPERVIVPATLSPESREPENPDLTDPEHSDGLPLPIPISPKPPRDFLSVQSTTESAYINWSRTMISSYTDVENVEAQGASVTESRTEVAREEQVGRVVDRHATVAHGDLVEETGVEQHGVIEETVSEKVEVTKEPARTIATAHTLARNTTSAVQSTISGRDTRSDVPPERAKNLRNSHERRSTIPRQRQQSRPVVRSEQAPTVRRAVRSTVRTTQAVAAATRTLEQDTATSILEAALQSIQQSQDLQGRKLGIEIEGDTPVIHGFQAGALRDVAQSIFRSRLCTNVTNSEAAITFHLRPTGSPGESALIHGLEQSVHVTRHGSTIVFPLTERRAA